MGSGDSPNISTDYGFSNLPTEIQEMIKRGRFQEGLPMDIKQNWLGNISNESNIAYNRMKEQVRQNTLGRDIPSMSGVRALGDFSNQLYTNKLGQLTNVGLQDVNIRQDNLSKLLSLVGTSAGITQAKNQAELNRYGIEQENSFKIGDAIGALLQAGGQVGGAAVGRPGK